tara:strand:- start:800 stop:901 length:102 start_codon:yes stop_codon:yes gene_type:complete
MKLPYIDPDIAAFVIGMSAFGFWFYTIMSWTHS